jgi:putative toxin-antitoxin system antitoxin component (TIGR02293 family)
MATLQTEEETRRVIALLGGRKVFPRRVRGARGLEESLRNGLSYDAFEAILEVLELRPRDLADILGVAPRTLARRKTTNQLSPIESDRLYRVALITSLAAHTLGSLEKARTWLHRENRALGGEAPVSVLDTEIGERRVEELLNRINYGIVS